MDAVVQCQRHGRAGAQRKGAGQRHTRMLPAIVRPGGGEEFLWLPLLLPGPEHMAARMVGKIAVAEALTGEGGAQLLHLLGGGFPPLPDGPGIDARHHGHIFRPLHAPLDLQAGHAQLLQFPEVPGQRHILQREQRFVRPLAPAIAQPAGLGAQAPVAAAGADHGGEEALAGIAHTLGAVAEHFDLNGGMGADVADLIPGKLPGQHRPGAAQIRRPLHAVQIHNAHLGAGVDGQIRSRPAHQIQYAQILHQHRVRPCVGGKAHLLRRAGQLRVREQRVQGQIDLDAPDVTVFHRLGELFRGEIFCVAPGIIITKAQIDRPRAALNGGGDRLPGPGRRQQFQHDYFLSLPLLRRKISRLASLRSAFIWADSSSASFSWRRRRSLASISLK